MFVLALFGAALLAVVLIDIAMTTLTMRGAGPLTSWVMQGMWRGLLHATPSGAHRLLAAAGTAVVVSSILIWVVLLWAAWSLVFLGGGAVVETDTGLPTGFWDTVYFAAFTLFTLGLGDFRPEGALWQIMTGICAANGLLALTMSVTYLMPVLSAAAGQRQLAARIYSLGSTPDGILVHCWNGTSFSRLREALDAFTPAIILQSQQHLAYPALNYFHSDDQKTSLPLRIAALDEALTVLGAAAPDEASPHHPAVAEARSAIALLLEAMDSAHIEPSEQAPPPPPPERLRRRGLPEFDLKDVSSAVEASRQRRCLMFSWIRNDARRWEEVWEAA